MFCRDGNVAFVSIIHVTVSRSLQEATTLSNIDRTEDTRGSSKGPFSHHGRAASVPTNSSIKGFKLPFRTGSKSTFSCDLTAHLRNLVNVSFSIEFSQSIISTLAESSSDQVTSWGGAEHGPPRGGGVILGHERSVVDGDAADGRDLPAPGGLASR